MMRNFENVFTRKLLIVIHEQTDAQRALYRIFKFKPLNADEEKIFIVQSKRPLNYFYKFSFTCFVLENSRVSFFCCASFFATSNN